MNSTISKLQCILLVDQHWRYEKLKFIKGSWPLILVGVLAIAFIPMLISLDPRLGKLPAMFWNSAGAKAAAVLLIAYGLYCIFMGDGSGSDIIGLVPAICVGAISYVLFSIPPLGNMVGIILGLIVLAIALDKAAKYMGHHQNKTIDPGPSFSEGVNK